MEQLNHTAMRPRAASSDAISKLETDSALRSSSAGGQPEPDPGVATATTAKRNMNKRDAFWIQVS